MPAWLLGVIFLAPLMGAAVGAWRGTRSKLPGYFDYLLRRLPPDSRLTIATLLGDESRRYAKPEVANELATFERAITEFRQTL